MTTVMTCFGLLAATLPESRRAIAIVGDTPKPGAGGREGGWRVARPRCSFFIRQPGGAAKPTTDAEIS